MLSYHDESSCIYTTPVITSPGHVVDRDIRELDHSQPNLPACLPVCLAGVAFVWLVGFFSFFLDLVTYSTFCQLLCP